MKDEPKMIYALFDPDGVMCRCSENLDAATNFFPSGARHASFTSEMWNDLFGVSPKNRKEVYEENGWRVLTGTFIQNDEEAK